MGDADAFIATGREALDTGDWAAARDAFAAAVAADETPEALLGLADALWWLEDVEASQRRRERAYAALRRAGAWPQAAGVAMTLCINEGRSLGNQAAARGWLGRAARLVADHGLVPLEGWVLLGRAALANEGGDVAGANDLARAAAEAARTSGDADLELCAISLVGATLVKLGRVEEGAALLDEAMAGALAGEGSPDTAVYASCVTVAACSLAAELGRALRWIRAAEEFNRRYGSVHLYAVCRAHRGGVLFAAGRWEEAETELERALRTATATEPAQRVRAVAALAELRLAQGRVEEAVRLLDGQADRPEAARALGAVRLATGEPAGAAAVLARRLRDDDEIDVVTAPLHELLATADLAQGDVAAAEARARRVAEAGAQRGSDAIAAPGDRALGRVLATAGDPDGAVDRFERALAAFVRLELPYEAARTRLAVAEVLARGRAEAAIAEAREALAALEALGAGPEADKAAALLRSLGVKAARSGPKGIGVLTKREQEVLALLGEGLSNRQIAERLVVAPKTAENHVSSVLFKLQLTGRAQAAAYAVRHLGVPPGER